jgi:hypothetical protein
MNVIMNYSNPNNFEHRRAIRRRNARIWNVVFALAVGAVAGNGAYWLLVWVLK